MSVMKQKLSKKDLEDIVTVADKDKNGQIDYKGLWNKYMYKLVSIFNNIFKNFVLYFVKTLYRRLLMKIRVSRK